jgi:hypothetical protein
MGSADLLKLGLIFVGLGLVAGVAFRWFHRRRGEANVSVLSSVEHMRSIGQLSVFKAFTKEIVTETDHSWGELGRRYLSWVVTQKKMAMIFEFEIDFRYDLRSIDFKVEPRPEGGFTISMPVCLFEVHIRDIRFYDEQRSRFLPWLLPDLLNGFLAGGFGEEDKNRLVAAARAHAQAQAVRLINDLQSEVQNSAQATLRSISRAFGADEVVFVFKSQGAIEPNVRVAPSLAEAAA